MVPFNKFRCGDRGGCSDRDYDAEYGAEREGPNECHADSGKPMMSDELLIEMFSMIDGDGDEERRYAEE